MDRKASSQLILGMVVFAVPLAPSIASAKPVHIPGRVQVDSACIYNVPKGAKVDANSGDVVSKSDLSVITHHEPCADPPKFAARSAGETVPGSATNWYDLEQAYAVNIDGLTQFNYMDISFTVPAEPQNLTDSSFVYLFPGLQNLDSSGNPDSLLQPVLQWGYNGSFGSKQHWVIASWVVNQTAAYNSGALEVSVGDTILGQVYQVGSDPDDWYVMIFDTNISEGTYIEYYGIPSSTPKYNWATLGLLEGYGEANQLSASPLNTCADLPTSDGENFQVLYLYQGGPSWDSYTDVTGLLTYQSEPNYYNLSPSCSWGASMYQAGGSWYSSLGWNYQL